MPEKAKKEFIFQSLREKVAKEKAESLFTFFLGFSPEFEIKDDRIIAKGQKNIAPFIEYNKEKFKELLKKEIIFEETKEKEEKHEHEHKHDRNQEEKIN